MKLSITTDCILRCRYCFVNKNNKQMEWKTAKKGIDFFLNSKGKNKILKIYGGEPLLNFNIVKKIVSYAKKQALSKNIKLTFSLCTNAILLKPEHIDFFKENQFQIAISFDGKRKPHDKYRKFPNGEGTYNKAKEGLFYLFRTIEKKNLAANMSVTPSETSEMFENFRHILEIGFDALNIEPIYGFQRWTIWQQKQFEKEFKSIANFIMESVPKGNFFFLTTINRELKYKTLSKLKHGACLFHQFPEVYPDGQIGFSSFFLNLPPKIQKKYIVGNVNSNIKNKFKNCSYSRDSQECKICLQSYFDRPDESLSSEIVKIRNDFSIDLANQIKEKAKNNLMFKKYIQEAKNHICF